MPSMPYIGYYVMQGCYNIKGCQRFFESDVYLVDSH
jgi:hypothetical protein